MENLAQQLFDFFSGAGREAALFIISMIPIVELRGAIPLGAIMGMEWYKVFAICIVGNLLPVPFILWFVRPVLRWLKTTKLFSKFTIWIENKLLSKAGKVTKYEVIGLCLFVAIPLPGTGAWTGAGIAALLDMKLKPALFSITCGVLIAACLMTAGSYGLVGLAQAAL